MYGYVFHISLLHVYKLLHVYACLCMFIYIFMKNFFLPGEVLCYILIYNRELCCLVSFLIHA